MVQQLRSVIRETFLLHGCSRARGLSARTGVPPCRCSKCVINVHMDCGHSVESHQSLLTTSCACSAPNVTHRMATTLLHIRTAVRPLNKRPLVLAHASRFQHQEHLGQLMHVLRHVPHPSTHLAVNALGTAWNRSALSMY